MYWPQVKGVHVSWIENEEDEKDEKDWREGTKVSKGKRNDKEKKRWKSVMTSKKKKDRSRPVRRGEKHGISRM